MSNVLKQILSLKTALWVNTFLFYFKRLWIIGKWMPDSVYRRYSLKRKLAVAAFVIRQVLDLAGKPLYLFCFVLLPVWLFLGSRPSLQGHSFSLMVNILFFLNCLLGSFGDSQIFAVTRDKITIIKYMRKDARSYTLAALCIKYIPFFLYYLPFILLFSGLLGGTAAQGVFLWIMLAAFRMMGEAFGLFVFARTGKVYTRSMVCSWFTIGVGLAGGYLLPYLGIVIPAGFLLHPLMVLLYLALGGVSLFYIIAGYQEYGKELPRSIDLNFLLSSLLKTSSGSSFKEVEIREKDVEIPHSLRAHSSSHQGYAYFNSLFFARHRRQLIRPVYYRLGAVGALFASSVILLAVNREAAAALSENMITLLPSFVYIMYFLTVADKACRAMFYNCDKDMLHYSFYRKPGTILHNFKIRLLHVCLYDSSIAAALCLAAILFCLLSGTSIFTMDMLLFCLTILLLSVLFTAHHLCLYYICQPYSESLKIKNPFFSTINVIMYVLCFLCLEIKVKDSSFTLGVLAFTVLYIAGALILVYRKAPKTFRIK